MLPGVTAAEICSNWGRLTKGEIKYVNDKASLRSPPYRRMKAHATQSRLECGAASGTFEAERQRSCLSHVAQQVGVTTNAWSEYAARDETRREHALELQSGLDYSRTTLVHPLRKPETPRKKV